MPETPATARQLSLMKEGRFCKWCKAPIDPSRRIDAKHCGGAKCRQAAHRFRVGTAGAVADVSGRPLRLAYADPPYPGLAERYYGQPEVDHRALLGTLSTYDGWALSTSATALPYVLSLCPPDVRVCPWVRRSRASRARRALNAWEPLIVHGGRAELTRDVSDVLIWSGRQHSHPGALVGMKPAAFAEWMFKLLGATQGDSLDDLFPGSGAIGRAWSLFQTSGADWQPSPWPALNTPKATGKASRLQEAQARV